MSNVPRFSLNEGTLKREVVTFGAQHVFTNETSGEFIRKRQPTLEKIKQLNLSARLVQEGMEIVLNNNGCMLLVDNDFVAEVKINRMDLLDHTRNFPEAKQVLFEQMEIVTVLVDKLAPLLANLRSEVVSTVESFLKQTLNDRKQGAPCIKLMRLVEKHSNIKSLSFHQLYQEIEEIPFVRDELTELMKSAQEAEKAVFIRSQFLIELGYRVEDETKVLYQRMRSVVMATAERHRIALMEAAPGHLKNFLASVDQNRILLITRHDLKIFSDLRSGLNEELFSKPLQDLEQRCIKCIQIFDFKNLVEGLNVTNEMFFFLCKSLQELTFEISEMTGLHASNLLTSSSSGWHPISKITWKEETMLTKSLERQYLFMFDLLKHFDLVPHYPKMSFQDEMLRLNAFENDSTVWDGVKSFIKQQVKSIEKLSLLKGIPEEIYVWYCLLDDVLYHALPKNVDLNDVECALHNYLKLIREATVDQLESVRKVTHNTIRLIVQVVPYLATASDDSSCIDRCILRKQMTIISSLEDPSDKCHGYHVWINVLNNYWKSRSDVIPKIVSKMPIPEMTLLKEKLLSIVSTASEKNVDNKQLLLFFGSYEKFLIYLNQVPFDWFIKALPQVDMQAVMALKKVEVVDYWWLKNTENVSYRVIDPRSFAVFCGCLNDQMEVPKHFVIEVLIKQLAIVEAQLKKKSWTSSDQILTEEDKLSTTCDMLFAMHESLLLIRKQAQYASFDQFYYESVNRLINLVETSISRADFTARVKQLYESICFFIFENRMTS